jgi:hypothetical protein
MVVESQAASQISDRNNRQIFLVGWGTVTLCLIWFAARLIAFNFSDPIMQWEIWEAKKLLEYGFWERKGAIVDWHFMTGRVAEPWLFNYTNHPYPALWMLTTIYYVFGGMGVIALTAILGLVGCLLLYRVLANHFGVAAAWFATALYATAPAAIAFDVNANVVAMGSIIWPFALWFVCPRTGGATTVSARPWLAAATIFLAGQLSWYALTVLPALLLAALPKPLTFGVAVRHLWLNPIWRRLGLAAALTMGLFVVQLCVYTPDFERFWEYFLMQSAGGAASPSRMHLLPQIVAKVLYQPGPALWLAAAIAGFYLLRRRSLGGLSPLILVATGYVIVFGITILVLTRFHYTEQSMYRYLLAPLTVLTAYACGQWHGRWRLPLQFGLVALAFLGVAFASARISSSRASTTAETLGSLIQETSRPEDMVLTNLRPMYSPYGPQDVAGAEYTRRIADRLLRFNIHDQAAVDAAFLPFRQKPMNCVFVRDESNQLHEDLGDLLEQRAIEITDHELNINPSPQTLFLRLRAVYWNISGRARSETTNSETPLLVKLRIYRLPVSELTPP